MSHDSGDKSIEATPYRRQKAREEGQVAHSQDLASAGLLIGSILIVMTCGASVVTFLGQLARRQLGAPPVLDADVPSVIDQFYRIGAGLAQVLLPVFALLLVVAVAVNLGQVGFLFVPRKMSFDANRINPLTGLQRLFTGANLIRVAFGLLKVAVVAGVAAWSLWAQRFAILSLSDLPLRQLAVAIASLTLWTCLKIGLALAGLAVLDYFYQRYKLEQDLRMTPQELREEMRLLQGNPQLAARRRAVQRQLILDGVHTDVPQADVVIADGDELAVAVRYDPETMPAPIAVAKGGGPLAQRIAQRAIENDVPVVQRTQLARQLYAAVDLNARIPATHYAAVAQTLRLAGRSAV